MVREEDMISFQLWYSSDLEHCLTAKKTLKIIETFEEKISSLDAEIEVEYQGATIGKYSLSWESGIFVLNTKATTCLAKDRCGIPEEKNSCCG